MKNTHCQSCGAPVALNKSCCPYCDTPYPTDPVTIQFDGAALCRVVSHLTPNPYGGNGGHACGCISVAYALDGRPVLEIEE